MALNFYTGGLLAVYGWNLFWLDRYKWALLILFIIVCIIKSQIPGDSTLFRLVSPFMNWPILGIIEKGRFANVGKPMAGKLLGLGLGEGRGQGLHLGRPAFAPAA